MVTTLQNLPWARGEFEACDTGKGLCDDKDHIPFTEGEGQLSEGSWLWLGQWSPQTPFAERQLSGRQAPGV